MTRKNNSSANQVLTSIQNAFIINFENVTYQVPRLKNDRRIGNRGEIPRRTRHRKRRESLQYATGTYVSGRRRQTMTRKPEDLPYKEAMCG